MIPEEYDQFIYDPADFRALAAFGTPPGREFLDTLREVGTAVLHGVITMDAHIQKLALPASPRPSCQALRPRSISLATRSVVDEA